MKTILSYFSLLFVWLSVVQAQPKYNVVSRMEVDINSRRGENFNLINLGERGFLTIQISEELLRSMRHEVIIARYDSAMRYQWGHIYALESQSNLSVMTSDGEHLYFLIPKPEFKYDILRLNVVNGQLSLIKYNKLVDMEITHFSVVNDIFLMGGTVNNRPVVVHFDYQHSKPKVLPQVNHLRANISRIDVSAEHGVISVLLNSSTKRKTSFYYQIYDLEGRLLHNYAVPYDKDYNLFSHRPYFIDRNNQYLFGMYSHTAKDKAQGIYVANFRNGEQEDFRFYDFSYLKNFFDFLVPKKKERVMTKIKNKRAEGKVPRHEYNFFVRNLLVSPERIYFMAESYIPIFSEGASNHRVIGVPGGLSYRNYTRTSFMLGGLADNTISGSAATEYFGDFRPDRNINNSRMPSAYRYKHAIICAFDKNAKLLWDNSFAYNDLESPRPSYFVQMSVNHDEVTMMHYQDKKLHYKSVFRSLPDSLQTIDLEEKNDKEKVQDRGVEQLEYWYGNYFLLYGIQEIKLSSSAEGPAVRRKVFYVSKIGEAPSVAMHQLPEGESSKNNK